MESSSTNRNTKEKEPKIKGIKHSQHLNSSPKIVNQIQKNIPKISSKQNSAPPQTPIYRNLLMERQKKTMAILNKDPSFHLSLANLGNCSPQMKSAIYTENLIHHMTIDDSRHDISKQLIVPNQSNCGLIKADDAMNLSLF
jgi:hypothetical protein